MICSPAAIFWLVSYIKGKIACRRSNYVDEEGLLIEFAFKILQIELRKTQYWFSAAT